MAIFFGMGSLALFAVAAIIGKAKSLWRLVAAIVIPVCLTISVWIYLIRARYRFDRGERDTFENRSGNNPGLRRSIGGVLGVVSGPSEFTIKGSLKNWSIGNAAREIEVDTLLLDSVFDEAQDLCIEPWFEACQNSSGLLPFCRGDVGTIYRYCPPGNNGVVLSARPSLSPEREPQVLSQTAAIARTYCQCLRLIRQSDQPPPPRVSAKTSHLPGGTLLPLELLSFVPTAATASCCRCDLDGIPQGGDGIPIRTPADHLQRFLNRRKKAGAREQRGGDDEFVMELALALGLCVGCRAYGLILRCQPVVQDQEGSENLSKTVLVDGESELAVDLMRPHEIEVGGRNWSSGSAIDPF
ncbi:hypothetical protein GGR58DRAFT_525232 [Xylaria digitata]|nr:hypothetical protein GGR58DRAFT_525232 [Xylaria digitata]